MMAQQRLVNIPDTLLMTVPGLQAEHAAKALTMEGLTCLLECDGLKRLRQPGDEAPEPLAVTWPVRLYVHFTDLTEAKRILDSIAAPDVIGQQWSDADAGQRGKDIRRQGREMPTASVDRADRANPYLSAPRAEGTTLRFVFLLAVALFLLLLFRSR